MKVSISDYYLNIAKISNLQTEDERNIIHNYYKDLLLYVSDPNMKEQSLSILNTLLNAGYLVKEEKEEKILS